LSVSLLCEALLLLSEALLLLSEALLLLSKALLSQALLSKALLSQALLPKPLLLLSRIRDIVPKELVLGVVEHGRSVLRTILGVLKPPNLLSVLLRLVPVASLLPLERVLLVPLRSAVGCELRGRRGGSCASQRSVLSTNSSCLLSVLQGFSGFAFSLIINSLCF